VFREFIDKVSSSDVLPRSAKQFMIHGDARDIPLIVPPRSVQCVITSPPYWGLRNYGHIGEIGAERTVEEYLLALTSIFENIRNSLKDNGTMWMVIGDCYTSGNRKYRHADRKHSSRAMSYRPRNPSGLKNKDLIGLPWRIAQALQANGWFLRSSVIWHKTNPMPESVSDRPHQAHEYIFLFSKSQRYFFDRNGLVDKSVSFNASRSVWSTSVNSGGTVHVAPFPAELVKPCILASTRSEDIILDPFAGSGSVGIACRDTNRNFVGIELIKDNVDFACSR
jgi:site-specific DNA-methyltransferase (adenine-specific)